ncbi:hypothetical protein GALMADRAFT_254999 [Galerina marginata CBS 339.88]|uniref:Uncharacterized protein n=1 Tax=Galerina marginata (strain CBS 339.88) TaxID=685588 RepID=A0A067SGV6_GALM3|nr:hypothetical protein GALMADRAFT_254999 [Galerina marginata CBS 339.88]
MLLKLHPNSRIAITEDKDWISVIREDDFVLPPVEEIYSRIMALFVVCVKEDMVFLEKIENHPNYIEGPLHTYESESRSSPYLHLHPIPPSSSLSSTDSAPRSEPRSDEQPDLGAFTMALREWTHLQPPPRIPVQIGSATSSTTPTFQPEQSVLDSDFHSRSGNSRLSTRSGVSGISSFTRPPSSSIHPEGSTVWNRAPIVLYLNSGAPSNDVIFEDEEEYESREGEYTPSAPNSLASTSLSVEVSEIAFPPFDGSQDSNQILLDSSPFTCHTDPGIAVAVPLESNSQRLDSRETGHTEEGLRPPSSEGHGDHSSRTSPDFVRPGVTGGPCSVPSFQSQVQSHDHSQTGSSITSVQLQSQARAPTTTAMSSSDSLALPVPVSTTITSTTRQVPSSTQMLHSGNDATSVNSSTSISTLINPWFTRSWDPQPPRTTSDSSFMTGSESSSDLSLLSYQIPETPPTSVDEDSDRDQGPSSAFSFLRPRPPRPRLPRSQFSSSSTSLPSKSSNSGSLSLKTQRSLLSSNSSSHSTTTHTESKPAPALPRFGRSDTSLHKAQPSQTSVHNSGLDRPGPSGHKQPFLHRQLVAERTIHLERQHVDDDDDYPYSHTPRLHAQAATPRGIPPRPEPSAPTSATQAEFPSQHRQAELSGQPFSQIQPQTHNTLVQRDVDLQNISQPPMEPQPTRLEEVSKQELPSLGYLDEALSFIAAERARRRAAGPSTFVTSGPSKSREVGDEAGFGEEGEGQEGEGEAEWKQVNDNDQDHPKRKRRRKRPPRSHGLPPGSLTAAAVDSPTMIPKVEGPTDDRTGVQVTLSPKKKKRPKSASASTSSRSLLLDSPSKTKAKAKAHEKEFLVPQPSISYSPSGGEKEKPPVTILHRTVNSQPTAQVMSGEDVDGGSDKDGGRTPTNSGEVASAKEPGVGLDRTPIDLVGKKGKRVGRKEREREKLKIDKAKSSG